MKSISLAPAELEAVKGLPERFRLDWPAVFSTNQGRKIWLWKRWGNTPSKERVYVRGKSRIVDAVADEYLSQRPDGGRFFIDDRGAFYSPEILGMKLSELPIVAFKIEQ
ncbi:MAG TPA: hypothetical protein VN872_00925 [Candidatus Acidoferrum sp.]|nr:hypothetical protein [Candidatus Acidoferrum sp.]